MEAVIAFAGGTAAVVIGYQLAGRQARIAWDREDNLRCETWLRDDRMTHETWAREDARRRQR